MGNTCVWTVQQHLEDWSVSVLECCFQFRILGDIDIFKGHVTSEFPQGQNFFFFRLSWQFGEKSGNIYIFGLTTWSITSSNKVTVTFMLKAFVRPVSRCNFPKVSRQWSILGQNRGASLLPNDLFIQESTSFWQLIFANCTVFVYLVVSTPLNMQITWGKYIGGNYCKVREYSRKNFAWLLFVNSDTLNLFFFSVFIMQEQIILCTSYVWIILWQPGLFCQPMPTAFLLKFDNRYFEIKSEIAICMPKITLTLTIVSPNTTATAVHVEETLLKFSLYMHDHPHLSPPPNFYKLTVQYNML